MTNLEGIQKIARAGGALVGLAGVVTILNSVVESGQPHAAFVEQFGEVEVLLGLALVLLGNLRINALSHQTAVHA